jgi:hypothetical protein
MSFAGLTTALFTALFGWLLHAEIPSVNFWTSFCIVCFGLVVFYQEELQVERESVKSSWRLKKQKPTPKPSPSTITY